MDLTRRHALLGLGAGSLLTVAPSFAAETYPVRPIKIVVPFAPGGTVDPAARLIGEELSKLSGVNFLVENRPGAGGATGTEYVARSRPDGYTLLASTNSMTVAQALKGAEAFDVVEDFTYIANFASFPIVVLINTARVEAGSLKELVDLSATRPEELVYGTAGVGSAAHLAAEKLKSHTDLRMKHIPYKGAGPATTDFLAGTIDILVSGLTPVLPLLGTENVKAILVTSTSRVPQAPDVPTVDETFPGFEFPGWLGLAGPKDLPGEVVEQLAGWLAEVLKNPTIDQRLVEAGFTPGLVGGAEVRNMVREELASFNEVVDNAGIRPD